MHEAHLSLRVVCRQEIATQVFEYTLAAADGLPLGPYEAGSHITVRSPNGAWRSYSLCGDPGDAVHWRIAVKREASGRGGSVALTDTLQAGHALTAMSPKNFFPLSQRARSFLLVAGGIGITPIYAMVQALLAQGQTSLRLVYCTRDAAATPYGERLRSLLGDKLVLHHDAGNVALGFDFWPLLEKPTTEHVYCCGPASLMDAVRDMTGHWPSEQLHFESFSGAQVPVAHNQPFEVVLARSGQTLQVSAERSVLEVLRAHGLAVPSSCETGCCGSCRVGLLKGRAEHRDLVLEASEQARAIMVCVSRAQDASLVLDL